MCAGGTYSGGGGVPSSVPYMWEWHAQLHSCTVAHPHTGMHTYSLAFPYILLARSIYCYSIILVAGGVNRDSERERARTHAP